jgi:DNA modification methylase
LLGGHRVLCGSVLDMTAVERLMAEERAAMVFTDPPYNVPIDGHATGLGKIHHRPFAMATGEMSSPAFAAFLARSLRNQAAAKDNGGMGSLYRSQHELVFVFKTGGGSHRNNVQLGRFGRNRSNVWHYPGVNSFGRKTNEGNLLEMHPTVKPVALVADAILDCTARGDIVLDGFLGSGTTVMAAERIGRRCFGTEIDPVYVDTIVRRWQSLTGGTARDAATGAAFDDLVRGAEVADAA